MPLSSPLIEAIAFRHPIVLLHHVVKSLVLITSAILIIWVLELGQKGMQGALMQLVLSPIALILFNYGMIKMVLALIHFAHKFVIIDAQNVIIFENTLFLQEDIETINRNKIVKIDIIRHGILSLFFAYGHLVLEQARNEVRTIHYICRPYEVVKYLQPHISSGSHYSHSSETSK